jgi:hypothetical protein
MLQRTPKCEAKRREMQRWRARDKSGVPYVGGDPPPEVIDVLIDHEWLTAQEAADPRMIFAAMCAALLTVRKKNVEPPTHSNPL